MFASTFFSITASLALSVLFIGSCTAKLSENYYSQSCPNVLDTVKNVVKSAVSKEPRMGASLLRLQFHDCFVNGCDASILLDDTSSLKGEKTASANNNSLRGFDVVDKIKSKVEKVCPGVVSCADILTIAARDSVVLLGGVKWDVKLGRRDSRTTNFTAADNWEFIPSSSINLTRLISHFKKQGLSAKDMVALSGAHTIGQASCASFRNRIYNDTNIDSLFAKLWQQKCPKLSGLGDDIQGKLDFESPYTFDTSYFKLLIKQKGLMHTDQELFNGGSTDSLVQKYSNSNQAFNADFGEAMIKMGDIKPLTGSKGEIRKDCRKAN